VGGTQNIKVGGFNYEVQQRKLTICNQMVTIHHMITVKQLPEFAQWMLAIKDGPTRRRLAVRVRKATIGNLGDVKSVGEGVFEMRENFGPGWRMYYVQIGKIMVVMLGGGTKSTQKSDIAKAIELAKFIKE
jgi:putative addiction module killer protein